MSVSPVTEGCSEKYGKRLIGKSDMEDALKKLNKLTPDIVYGLASCIIPKYQLQESIHRWLSPPYPSTNHNIACGTHHKKTATWFFQGSIYQEWQSKGSLLWIHGKRAPCPNFLSDTHR
jgi:hypothetical protein